MAICKKCKRRRDCSHPMPRGEDCSLFVPDEDLDGDGRISLLDFLKTVALIAVLFAGIIAAVIVVVGTDASSDISEPESPAESSSVIVAEAGDTTLFGMQHVGDDGDFYYYRDNVTGVLYVWGVDYGDSGFTVMLDPESGLPLTYDRYLELADAQYGN